jgi:hypothetical protein
LENWYAVPYRLQALSVTMSKSERCGRYFTSRAK